MLVPYVADEDRRRAWALSEISVAQRRIAACPPPAGTAAAVEVARRDWPAWERDSENVLLSVLTPEGEGYRLEALDGSRAPVTFAYDDKLGLRDRFPPGRDGP